MNHLVTCVTRGLTKFDLVLNKASFIKIKNDVDMGISISVGQFLYLQLYFYIKPAKICIVTTGPRNNKFFFIDLGIHAINKPFNE